MAECPRCQCEIGLADHCSCCGWVGKSLEQLREIFEQRKEQAKLMEQQYEMALEHAIAAWDEWSRVETLRLHSSGAGKVGSQAGENRKGVSSPRAEAHPKAPEEPLARCPTCGSLTVYNGLSTAGPIFICPMDDCPMWIVSPKQLRQSIIPTERVALGKASPSKLDAEESQKGETVTKTGSSTRGTA